MGIYSPVFFHSPQPNNIGPARQQPRDWGSLLISLSLVGEGGAQILLIALRLLDYMGFAMEASTEWKMEGGHTLQFHSLGTGDKCPPPQHTQFSEFFCLRLGGGTKVFYPRRPDYGRFKIPSFTSPGPLTALSVPPGPHFFQQSCIVI